MNIVIDTNVLWVSISRKSKTHWIFQAILNDKLSLCVTTEILDEYDEIMSNKLGPETSEAVLSVIDNLPNINFITRYFKWLAITQDPDDDKFVDCAVASDAFCILTEDKHFNVLKSLDFPVVKTMNISQFENEFFDTFST